MATAIAHAAAATPLAASQSLLFQLEVRLTRVDWPAIRDAIFARYQNSILAYAADAGAGTTALGAGPTDQAGSWAGFA